jgi:uncharacterized protein YqeY
MAELEDRIRGDLTTAMRERDVSTRTALRGVLAAIGAEKVAGDTARELSDADVETVLRREVRKRRESAEAFTAGNRPELAATETAEADLLSGYLPTQLDDAGLAALVAEAVEEVAAATGTAPGPRSMGAVMKAANARVAGRADGSRVAAAVRAALA